MEENDRMYLKKGYRFLHEYFQGNLELVLQHLVDKNVYDETMKADILDEKTVHQKCKKFLDEFPERGPLAWGHLMDIIKEEIQDIYVVDLIHPGYVKRKPPPPVDPNAPPGGPKHNPDDDDDDMGFEVVVKPSEEFIFEDKVYKNDTTPRGLALIINIMKCVGQTDRLGTERDSIRLRSLFIGLGYEVTTKDDLNSSDMENCLTEFANDGQHNLTSSCIITILSHGTENAVFGSDGKPLKLETIFEKFDNNHAKFLQDKPKCFIIQACRGKNIDAPDLLEVPDNLSSTAVAEQTSELQSPEPFPIIVEEPSKSKLPVRSDMICAYSTLLQYVALRHQEKGARFIRTIIDVFKDNACKDHLSDLLTEVNRRMKIMETDSKIKQQSEFNSCLAKKFYFFPGLSCVD